VISILTSIVALANARAAFLMYFRNTLILGIFNNNNNNNNNMGLKYYGSLPPTNFMPSEVALSQYIALISHILRVHDY
jgi:hypothetical protein